MNRTNFDGIPVVVIGDKTSHGGVVLTGDKTTMENGVGMARVGDDVYCPRCKPHIHKIIQGSSNCPTPNGQAIALNNDGTSCGATLIAAAASNINEAIIFLARADASGLEQAQASMFNDAFQLVDEETDIPLAHHEYAIVRANGIVEHGVTSESGHTHLLSSTVESESLDIYA